MTVRKCFPAAAVLVAAACLAVAGQQGAAKPTKLVADGTALYVKGDTGGALAKFSRALALKGDFAPAAHGKAAVQFIQGRFAQADDTLRTYMQKVATDPYAWMLALVCQDCAGYGKAEARGTLSQMQALVSENSWFGRTIALFLGTRRPANYLAPFKRAADRASSPRGGASQKHKKAASRALCRAYFFVGAAYRFNANDPNAAKAFKLCVEVPGDFQWEREMAKAQLARLEKRKKK